MEIIRSILKSLRALVSLTGIDLFPVANRHLVEIEIAEGFVGRGAVDMS
jgi:hypothetical protein